MLYLKNSLVNLTIPLFLLFFLTNLCADNSNFIFPKKKITTIKIDETKQSEDKNSENFKISDLPQKKPLRKISSSQKNLKNNIKNSKTIETKIKKIIAVNDLPQKKPISKNNTLIQKVDKPYLEIETQKIINEIKEKKSTSITD